jgi:hypothetical protein
MARDFTPTPHRHLKQCRFLAELLTGATPEAAARRVGHSLKTLYSWRRRNPVFRRAWDKARAHAKHPPFPGVEELETCLGSTTLLLPGECQVMVLPQPGQRMWIEAVTRRRTDGRIETTRREIEPTAAERAAFDAKYRAWDAAQRHRGRNEPKPGGTES